MSCKVYNIYDTYVKMTSAFDIGKISFEDYRSGLASVASTIAYSRRMNLDTENIDIEKYSLTSLKLRDRHVMTVSEYETAIKESTHMILVEWISSEESPYYYSELE